MIFCVLYGCDLKFDVMISILRILHLFLYVYHVHLVIHFLSPSLSCVCDISTLTSIECDLEGRFSRIRTGETNLGNLVTDIMRQATRSEIALLNSGTFRSDAVHEAGAFRVKVSSTPIPTYSI